MADDETTPERSPEEEVAFWKAEAQKAFKRRDEVKSAMAELESKGLSADERAELERFQKEAAEAEEKRQRQAGEFDKLKERLEAEKAAEAQRADQAVQAMRAKLIELEFQSASDLFGPDGLTIMPADFAAARFAQHVRYEPGQDGAADRIVVLGLDGEIITDDRGQPAPFRDGMSALIEQWPDKDRILRSGQKAGSGSSGGTRTVMGLTREEALRRVEENPSDREALAVLARSQPQGRTVAGPIFQKQREQEIAARAK